MDPIWWIIIFVIILVVFFLLIYWGFYNKIIRMENRIDNSWAQIDVQLRRRAELIPNLMETVKGYMKHEKEVLENVTKARSALVKAKTPRKTSTQITC
jgi:LemA protein